MVYCILIDLVRRSFVRVVVDPTWDKLQRSYEKAKKNRVLCESSGEIK